MFSALHLLSYLVVALCVSLMLFFPPEEVANPSLPPPPEGMYYFRSNETWKVLDYDRVETLRHRLLLGYMMSNNNLSVNPDDYHHLLESSAASSSSPSPHVPSLVSSEYMQIIKDNLLATELSPSAIAHNMSVLTLMSNLDEKSIQHMTSDFASFADLLAHGNHSMKSVVKRPVERVEVEKIIMSQLLHMLSLSQHQEYKNRNSNSENATWQREHGKLLEVLRSIAELPLRVHVIAAAHGSQITADNVDDNRNDIRNTFTVHDESILTDRVTEKEFNDLTFIHAAMLHKTNLIIPNCESATFGFLVKYERDSVTQVLRTDKSKYIPVVTVSTGNLMNSASLCLASLIEYSFHNFNRTETITMTTTSKRARGTAQDNHFGLFKVQSITFIGTAQVSPVVGAGGWHVQARTRDKFNEYLQNIHEKEQFEQMLKIGTLHKSTDTHASLQNGNQLIKNDNKKKTKCSKKQETNVQSEDVDVFINPACQHEMFFAQNAMLMPEHQYEQYREQSVHHDLRHSHYNREEMLKREAEMFKRREKEREVQASKKVALGSVCVTDMAIMGECGFCSEDTPVTSLCSRPRCGSHNSTTFFGKCVFLNEFGSKLASHRMAARMKGAILRSTLPPIPFLVKEGMREYWSNFEAIEEYVPVITHSHVQLESSTNHESGFMYYLQHHVLDALVKKIQFVFRQNNSYHSSNNSSTYVSNKNDDNVTTSNNNNTNNKQEIVYEYNRAAPSNATVLNCAEVSSHELKYSIREDALCREYVAEVYNLSSLSLQKEMNSELLQQQQQQISPNLQRELYASGLLSGDDVSCVRGREGVSLLHLVHSLNKQAMQNSTLGGDYNAQTNNNNKNSLAESESLQSHQPQNTRPTEPIPIVIVRGASSYTSLPIIKRQYKKEQIQMRTREGVLNELRRYNEFGSITTNNSNNRAKKENVMDEEFVQWSQMSLSRLNEIRHGRSSNEAEDEEKIDNSNLEYMQTPEFIKAAYEYAIETASAAVLNYFLTDDFDEQDNVQKHF